MSSRRSSATEPGASLAGQIDIACCPVCGGALDDPLLYSPDRLCGLPGAFSVARCKECGLGVTLPRIEVRRLASLYPSTYGSYELPSGALRFLSKTIQRVQSWHALRTAPLKRLVLLPAGRLLDVGCGRGDLGAWLVQRGWSVVGVEPSADACAVARARGVDARVGTLAEAHLESETYDAVVFRQSLEHVTDPVVDLCRAREALRNGGVAIVSVPNFGCWQRRFFGERWFHLDLPRHRLHFEESTLSALFRRVGFVHIEVCTSSSSVGLPASIQYAIAGRCLFPTGLKMRLAAATCAFTMPLAWMLNRMVGEGDVLHIIAHAP
jgi:SAM-dependent methyltransferase